MNVIPVVSNTPEWMEIRALHDTASEAPAAHGKSKFTSRTDLMRQKATGLTPEVGGAKQSLFNRGHSAEASARSLAEAILGGELYPVTATLTIEGIALLASLDGATMDEEIIWEHKLFSESLAADVRAGTLDPHYTLQLDQQLLVSGAKKCLFMTSDGTDANMAWCWYESSQAKFDVLVAGWKQFRADLAAYVPATPMPVVVATVMESLPAVVVRVQGELVVASNLPEFGLALRAFIDRIPVKPTTDQEFADTESACKALKKAEDALESAETSSLAQLVSVEEMRRMTADLRNLARTTRLAKEKLVVAQKDALRLQIVQRGKAELAAHMAALNTRLGKPYMPEVSADFANAIKNKRTIESLNDAVNTLLANTKIEASAIADKIQANLATLVELGSEHKFLFADAAQIVLKAPDDLTMLVKSRISEHKAAEEKRIEAERERIRTEELARIEREQEASRRAAAAVEAAKALAAAAVIPPTVAAPAAPAPVVMLHGNLYVTQAQFDKTYPVKAAESLPPPKLTLGLINKRLAPIQLTAEGLRTLGFEPAGRDRAAVLYHEADFLRICAALVNHIGTMYELQAA